MRRLLVADGAAESREGLLALFRDQCEVAACADGETALALLQDFSPDVLVLDLMLPGVDGLGLLQTLCQQETKPLILTVTGFASAYVLGQLRRLGVDYVMLRPCRMEALEARVNDLLNLTQSGIFRQASDDGMIADLLLNLGFSPKLDGYSYLLEAIPLYAQDPSQAITKELYAAVGEPRRKTAALVERAIRSAIDKAWREGDPSIWKRYFPVGLRPSNGAFIARMAQQVGRTAHRIIVL